jgi:hypothetical protein
LLLKKIVDQFLIYTRNVKPGEFFVYNTFWRGCGNEKTFFISTEQGLTVSGLIYFFDGTLDFKTGLTNQKKGKLIERMVVFYKIMDLKNYGRFRTSDVIE